MTIFLGVDGGGTGCRVAVADARGRILGRATGGPANINTDVRGAAENILDATRIALAGSGIAPQSLVATLGLAGGTMQQAIRELTARLPFARVQVVNDGVTAARGALGTDDGILAAMGTGSVFARQLGGRILQVGGRGFLMGDEGSAAVLGRALLARAMQAADGFVPMTQLLAALLDKMGGTVGIIAFGNHATPGDFGAFAPRVTDADDPAAVAIREAALDQVRHIIATLQAGRSLPVVFVGGLGAHYAAGLAGLWPQRAPRGDAVDGALLMARQMDPPG